MRTRFLLALLGILFFTLTSTAQLADGSQAPDFTLTDIEGNTHNLYDILNEGKSVVLDFSATWCSPCWSYHTSGAMEDFWEEHGPDGTDESQVFFIECDLTTGMDDLNGETSGTQGDWVSNTPYPIIDLQNTSVVAAYNVGYYPTIFKVCPDGTVYEVGTVPSTVLGNWIQSCSLDASLASTTGTECYGEEQGAASLDVTGGYGTPSYSWSDGSNNADLSNVEAGNYTVTVTDDNGKTDVISPIIIDGPENPIEITNEMIIDVSCNGGASGIISLDAQGGNGVTEYLWSNGETGSEITGLAIGIYDVTIVDASNCEIYAQYEVLEPDVLESFTAAETAHCGQADGTINVSIVGGTAPFNIECNGGTVNNQNQTINNLQSGVYQVTVIDALGCETIIEDEVMDTDGPTLVMSESEDLSCMNPTTSIDALVTYDGPSVQYNWSTLDGNIVSGLYTESIIVSEPGTYELLVLDQELGCEATESVTILASFDEPTATLGADLSLDCDNLQFSLEVAITNANSDVQISWTTPDGNIIFGDDDNLIDVDAPGTYIVVVTNTENGCSATDELVVTDDRSLPEANFTSTSDYLVTTFTNTSSGDDITYMWDFGDGNTSTSESPVYTYSFGGIYSVCLTTTNNCGSEVNCFDIVVEAEQSAIQVSYLVTHVNCFGSSDGSISVVTSGGMAPYTYSWSGPDGYTNTDQNLSNLSVGNYILVIEDSQSNDIQIQIIVNQPDELVSDYTLADGPSGYSIDLSVSGGVAPYTYTWSNGATTEDLDDLPNGTYSCVITDNNGCESYIDDIRIGFWVEFPDNQKDWAKDSKLMSVDGNPTIQPLVIFVPETTYSTNFRYQVVNVSGQTIDAGEWYGANHQVDLRGQAPGVYFMAIFEEGQWSQTEKLIISE